MAERVRPGPQGFRKPGEQQQKRNGNTRPGNGERRKPRDGQGRPAWTPTDETRKLIMNMAGVGVTPTDIATILETSEPTLRKYCSSEIEKGRALMNSVVLGKLYTQIQNNNFYAIQFWLRVKCGWTEARAAENTPEKEAEELSDEQLNGEIEALRSKAAFATTARGLAPPVQE